VPSHSKEKKKKTDIRARREPQPSKRTRQGKQVASKELEGEKDGKTGKGEREHFPAAKVKTSESGKEITSLKEKTKCSKLKICKLVTVPHLNA